MPFFVPKLSAGLLSGLGRGKVGTPKPVSGMVFMGTSVLRGLDIGGWGECLESSQAWFYVLRDNQTLNN